MTDGPLSTEEIARAIREARENTARSLPVAWCEPCQRHHVAPRDEAHARELRCKAFAPLPQPDESTVKPHPRVKRASAGRARACVFAKPRNMPKGRAW